MNEMYIVVAKRFARAAVAGAVAQMLVIAAATQSVATFKELEAWLVVLVVGALTGSLQALDKAIRYQE